MKPFALTPLAAVVLSSLVGCASVDYSRPGISSQEVARTGDYCHKILQPVGPPTPTRVAPAAGDTTDYYGPCDGPTLAEQIQQQRRFESYRFGKDYMDEG